MRHRNHVNPHIFWLRVLVEIVKALAFLNLRLSLKPRNWQEKPLKIQLQSQNLEYVTQQMVPLSR
jgi:hypothetical protein